MVYETFKNNLCFGLSRRISCFCQLRIRLLLQSVYSFSILVFKFILSPGKLGSSIFCQFSKQSDLFLKTLFKVIAKTRFKKKTEIYYSIPFPLKSFFKLLNFVLFYYVLILRYVLRGSNTTNNNFSSVKLVEIIILVE